MAKKTPPSADSVCELDPLVEPHYKAGLVRLYVVTTPPPAVVKNRQILAKETLMVAGLLVATLFVRLARLATPDSVVFDEVHFGGFARKYILGQFFMDVHPPLAKMLFAAVGVLGGFNGDFTFETIGLKYPEEVPYVLMRAFPALLGVGTVLMAYLTVRASGCRPVTALATAALLAVENANVTISRYILLDSPLLFFIATAVYATKRFEVQTPFSFAWYKSLVAAGIALGLAVSSKWVGLFTIAWVGVSCIYQLWFIVGDLTVPPRRVAGHFVARGALLLGIPAVLYVLFFAIHFQLLHNEGDGSPFMSSAFRASLDGNSIPKDIVAPVGLGLVVNLRHVHTKGGYLHSHNSFYPTGSKQQQITLYPHLDSNNDWIIEPYNDTIPDVFEPLVDGTKIRLRHVNTGRRLHSHDEKAPVSERDWQKEASCYGFDGFDGDANDDFVVEIVDYASEKGPSQKEVRALTTIFRLRHAMTGSYLFSSEVKLPDWGHEQQEVTTATQGYRPLTHWYIETNINSRLGSDVEIINYPELSLWDKIVESHKTMWQINQGLTEHHNWQSLPYEWPLLLRGINYWVRDHTQVYFLGNAVSWWAASLGIVVFVVHAIVSIFRWQSGATGIATNKHVYNFNSQVFLYTLGWLLHYFPFFIMGRQLFLHHYVPAHYFAALAFGHYLDLLVNYLAAANKAWQRFSYGVVAVFVTLSLLFYVHHLSLIYGTPWTTAQCVSSKALRGWDYDCNSHFDSLAEYSAWKSTADADEAAALESAEAEATPVENQGEFKEVKETPYVLAEKAVSEESVQSAPAAAEEKQPEEEAPVPPLAMDLEETK